MKTEGKVRASTRRELEKLRKIALIYPETHEDFPWGESAFKVRGKKVFVFASATAAGLGLSTKLPLTGDMALLLPFTVTR